MFYIKFNQSNFQWFTIHFVFTFHSFFNVKSNNVETRNSMKTNKNHFTCKQRLSLKPVPLDTLHFIRKRGNSSARLLLIDIPEQHFRIDRRTRQNVVIISIPRQIQNGVFVAHSCSAFFSTGCSSQFKRRFEAVYDVQVPYFYYGRHWADGAIVAFWLAWLVIEPFEAQRECRQ